MFTINVIWYSHSKTRYMTAYAKHLGEAEYSRLCYNVSHYGDWSKLKEVIEKEEGKFTYFIKDIRVSTNATTFEILLSKQL